MFSQTVHVIQATQTYSVKFSFVFQCNYVTLFSLYGQNYMFAPHLYHINIVSLMYGTIFFKYIFIYVHIVKKKKKTK